METDARIYVAGHRGLVGSAIVRGLARHGYADPIVRSSSELDLRDPAAVDAFFAAERPEYVFVAAAKVGGIVANDRFRAEFLYDNLMIEANVIHAAWRHGVRKLLFLGSTCIYPREAPQPMPEDALLTGPLEYTNEPYAVAKIAGMKLCESYNLQYGTNFLSVMPTNLYGPNDNYDLENSHVLAALVRKMHLAKLARAGDWAAVARDLGVDGPDEARAVLDRHGIRGEALEVWGTGTPKREFLYSEDLAEGCLFVMREVDFDDVRGEGPEVRNTHLNIGTGQEVSIRELAEKIRDVVGFEGEIVFDTSRPDGTPRKLTDVSKLHRLGWRHRVDLEEGLRLVYRSYLEQFTRG
jgi:GDP-L-fucose synthase